MGDRSVVAGMTRLLRLAAAAAAVAIGVAACSSGNDSSGSAASGAATTTSAAAPATSAPAGGEGSVSTGSASITIQNFAFGNPTTVAPGTSVKVTNMDTAGHDLVSDDTGKFAVPILNQGESRTFTAPTAGTYQFSCTVHANMKGIGTLIVQG
jgi:plastocyanin